MQRGISEIESTEVCQVMRDQANQEKYRPLAFQQYGQA